MLVHRLSSSSVPSIPFFRSLPAFGGGGPRTNLWCGRPAALRVWFRLLHITSPSSHLHPSWMVLAAIQNCLPLHPVFIRIRTWSFTPPLCIIDARQSFVPSYTALSPSVVRCSLCSSCSSCTVYSSSRLCFFLWILDCRHHHHLHFNTPWLVFAFRVSFLRFVVHRCRPLLISPQLSHHLILTLTHPIPFSTPIHPHLPLSHQFTNSPIPPSSHTRWTSSGTLALHLASSIAHRIRTVIMTII
ncbi:hypothetical protein C8Q73DRAFT_131834 [Cubamyces lactineus]|nr:hypothetical protein C8Q73DRAFT_131834 [Cubamyces lactineus]